MTTINAFVKKLTEKSGTSAKGRKWTIYSARLETAEGNELPEWYGFGFEQPKLSEGDFAEFTIETTDRGINVKSYSKKEAPKVAAKAPGKAPATASPSGSRDTAIQYQSSRKDALELVKLLLSADALPISSAKTKPGEAKRFQEIKLAVDKLTVEYFNDVQTLRILDSVADAGAIGEDDVSDESDDSEDESQDD